MIEEIPYLAKDGLLMTWFGDGTIGLLVLLAILIAITILKGLAIYKAARLQEKGWFWVLLILNSAGLLPAIYLYINRKKKVN